MDGAAVGGSEKAKNMPTQATPSSLVKSWGKSKGCCPQEKVSSTYPIDINGSGTRTKAMISATATNAIPNC